MQNPTLSCASNTCSKIYALTVLLRSGKATGNRWLTASSLLHFISVADTCLLLTVQQ